MEAPQTIDMENPRYLPPHLRGGGKLSLEAQRIKERKCKHCGEKWDLRHKCLKGNNTKIVFENKNNILF
jgi:hypothetical protein